MKTNSEQKTLVSTETKGKAIDEIKKNALKNAEKIKESEEQKTERIKLMSQEKKIHECLMKGDLSSLTFEEKTHYYLQVCKSIGVNPLTKPFDYLVLNRKDPYSKKWVDYEILYANAGCASQLRKIHNVSVSLETIFNDGYITVIVKVIDGSGRVDQDLAIISRTGLSPYEFSNACKKSVTQAKRRVSLSFCGLAEFDQEEVDAKPSIIENVDKIKAIQENHSPLKQLDKKPTPDKIQIEPEKEPGKTPEKTDEEKATELTKEVNESGVSLKEQLLIKMSHSKEIKEKLEKFGKDNLKLIGKSILDSPDNSIKLLIAKADMLIHESKKEEDRNEISPILTK